MGYPVYDAHGNMVATLFKSGSAFTLGDQRSYDAWGVVRSGNATGEPNARYCANLGHLADDESGLTYMRAQYYEASSGRFLSQDPTMHGSNWHIYARNNPISRTDSTGREEFEFQGPAFALMLADFFAFGGLALTMGGGVLLLLAKSPGEISLAYKFLVTALALSSIVVDFMNCLENQNNAKVVLGGLVACAVTNIAERYSLGQIILGVKIGQMTAAAAAISATFLYCITCMQIIEALEQ